MGERRDPRGLQLFGCGIELVPGRRHGNARFFEYLRIGPDPVHAVDVDRGGHIFALIGDDVLQQRGQKIVPVLGLGHIVDIVQHALARPILDVGSLHLDNRGRIARQHARTEHGCLGIAAAAGDRTVFPGAAGRLEFLFQFQDRLGFAARGPVMQDLDLGPGKGRTGDGERGKPPQKGRLQGR